MEVEVNCIPRLHNPVRLFLAATNGLGKEKIRRCNNEGN